MIARIWLVTKTLLRGNCILLALLLLWPCALSAILLAAGKPSVEDAASVLAQQLFYGLILVGLGASTAFGTEQRARRTQQILGRAVSRSEYLAALGLSAWLPFAAYVGVWLVNACSFARLLGSATPGLLQTTIAAFIAGVLLCTCGLLFSTLLPALAAAGCTGAVLALLLGIGKAGGVFGLFHTAAGLSPAGQGDMSRWPGVLESLCLASLLFALAAARFDRKDIPLS